MQNKVINSIFFFDSNNSLDELKFLMDKNPDHILISLDYSGYTELLKENIQCETSDSYLEKMILNLFKKYLIHFLIGGKLKK